MTATYRSTPFSCGSCGGRLLFESRDTPTPRGVYVHADSYGFECDGSDTDTNTNPLIPTGDPVRVNRHWPWPADHERPPAPAHQRPSRPRLIDRGDGRALFYIGLALFSTWIYLHTILTSTAPGAIWHIYAYTGAGLLAVVWSGAMYTVIVCKDD